MKIVFHSPRGGTGNTFIACNVAAGLAANTPLNIALVDMDLHYGDLHIFLNIQPIGSLGNLAPVLKELKPDDVLSVAIKHASGLSFLMSPVGIDQAETFSAEDVLRLLQVLDSLFDVVIVNTSSRLDDRNLALIEDADFVYIVTTTDINSTFATHKFLNLVKRIGVKSEAFRVIVNCAGQAYGLSLEDIAKQFYPFVITCEIPYEPKIAHNSVNAGELAVFMKTKLYNSFESIGVAIYSAALELVEVKTETV